MLGPCACPWHRNGIITHCYIKLALQRQRHVEVCLVWISFFLNGILGVFTLCPALSLCDVFGRLIGSESRTSPVYFKLIHVCFLPLMYCFFLFFLPTFLSVCAFIVYKTDKQGNKRQRKHITSIAG